MQKLLLNLIGSAISSIPELYFPLPQTTLVHWDNGSFIYLSGNPMQLQRTKHIKMNIHFFREKVALGQTQVFYVSSLHQIVYIFTKGLPQVPFDNFHASLNVREPPT